MEFDVNTAGQTFKQTDKFVCLGGCTSDTPDLLVDIARQETQGPRLDIGSMDVNSMTDPARASNLRSGY